MKGESQTVRNGVRGDRHTLSLLTDHMVFSPKYRGRVLVGAVRDYAEEVIRETCSELGIEIVRMSVSSDHVHMFYKYPPKLSVSRIANMIKGRSSRMLRARFPHLKEWCERSLWAPSCFHGSIGHGMDIVEKYIRTQKDYAVEERVAAIRSRTGRRRYRSRTKRSPRPLRPRS